MSPVESYEPQNLETIDLTTPTTFNINVIAPIPNTLSIEWSLNGTIINNEDFSVLISQGDLNTGNNTLQATIEDTPSLLKVDDHESIHLTTTLWNINSSTLSIDNVSLERLKIDLFPNPTQGVLYFDITKEINEDYAVTISDIYGKQLIKKNIHYLEPQPQIQLESLNSGVYFINFKFENGLIISKKIIKK